uniref:Pco080890 n=1 Tax=Arundo donax TaxID=35708 RepID=A0A0A9SYB9_ARUDO
MKLSNLVLVRVRQARAAVQRLGDA